MACKLIWSPEALNDLRDIVRYIAIDNPEKAGSFGIALIGKVELLANFPEMGRVVPEHRIQVFERLSSVLTASSTG